MSEVGEMGPQLANMALLYLFIGLLNRRSRRLGDAAARQVSALSATRIPRQSSVKLAIGVDRPWRWRKARSLRVELLDCGTAYFFRQHCKHQEHGKRGINQAILLHEDSTC
eukprot:1158012-Pelagomonas_calceolata.AAC.3